MRQRRFFVVLGAVALTAAVVPSASASADRGGDGPAARVWVTSADRAELLHDRGTVAFGTRPTGELTITVDPSRTYQTVDGFGASITDSSAAVLYRLDPAAREQAMRSLFDPVRGIGVSALRQPIGASDFTDEPHYTYDDVPAGTDRLRAGALQRRPRPGADPAVAAPGQGAEPAADRDRHPVEPAGVDEDHRLPHRRTADGRPPHLRHVRAVLRQVRPGLPGRRRPGRLPHGAERAAEPEAERLPGHGSAGGAGGQAHRGGGTGAAGGGPPDQDPCVRPQLVDPPGRHRHHAARRGPRDRLPVRGARQPGREVGRRHRLPLLLR